MSEVGVRAAALILALSPLIGLLLTGCAEAPPSPPEIHDIGEPWQPAPFAIDESVLAAVERTCRSNGMVDDGLPVSVMDARGGSLVLLVLTDATHQGECVITRDRSGALATGIGSVRGGVGAIQPIDPRAIENISFGVVTLGPLDGREITYVVGQAGVEVGLIEASLPDGTRVQTSNWGRGWFAAWWPGDRQNVRWSVHDVDGAPLAPPP